MTAPTFDTIEDTIAAFKAGEFIIVLDSADRENEGDLLIAAQDLTPTKMAYMINKTSGLICVPLSPARTAALKLPQMVTDNQEPHATAFTISVDARDGITTGISASDRARTANLLASPSATRADFRAPGHIFPLRAVDGGVRERGGHTEAAIAFARLSGKEEAVAICEIVREEELAVGGRGAGGDGGMMRRDECLAFGRRDGLRVTTIELLVEYLEARGESL